MRKSAFLFKCALKFVISPLPNFHKNDNLTNSKAFLSQISAFYIYKKKKKK